MTSKFKIAFLLLAALPGFCFAQENSPYSRYGVGNLLPTANIANRGMGGVSAASAEPTAVNTVNPASIAGLSSTTLDIGVEYIGRNIKSTDPLGTYRSNNGIISYLQVGLPLLNGNKKAFKNGVSWAIDFGLKPISRINYKILSAGKSVDSTSTLYEGEGGINEAFVGTALRIKKFSAGISTGYLFGEKVYNTRLSFNNDSVAYQKANYENSTRFGGMFLNAGIQYAFDLKKGGKKNGELRLGAYGNLKKSYNANRDVLRETFQYSSNGGYTQIDSVFASNDQKGKVQLPATLGVGFSVEKQHVQFGADFETTSWDDYTFFGEKDLVGNSWIARAGVQVYPASTGSKGYFNYVKYRAGISFGNDYIHASGDMPAYTISVGGGFPLKLRRSFYDLQYSTMNIALEYGNRGNKSNNITENIFKVSVGFSLSDVWFRRQKYD